MLSFEQYFYITNDVVLPIPLPTIISQSHIEDAEEEKDLDEEDEDLLMEDAANEALQEINMEIDFDPKDAKISEN